MYKEGATRSVTECVSEVWPVAVLNFISRGPCKRSPKDCKPQNGEERKGGVRKWVSSFTQEGQSKMGNMDRLNNNIK